MLFDPAANLIGAEDPQLGLRIIAGDVAVGQVCCDPGAFADVTTLVRPDAGAPAAALLLDPRVRALLRVVWPSTVPHARLVWGSRVAAQVGRHRHLDDLVPAVVGDVLGVPEPVLHRVVAQCRTAGRFEADAVARAAVPMALLHAATAEVVRTADSGQPDTVLEELLFWRGLGRERVTLDEIAALMTALVAAAWDATTALLARPAGAAGGGEPEVIGWLRVMRETVVLGGAQLPAGSRCLLVVDALEPADRPVRPALHALRWLAPGAPGGAGATFAGLVAEAVRASGHEKDLRGGFPSPALPGSGSGDRRLASRPFSLSAQLSSSWALPHVS
ncbi:hypothetical protein [Dactylosporangium sp. CA-092794]|uniref:hypothetical protein n=1 Tax=Dactylosporangium sp. CA-092794 TaxID=3239929 RepID=UPI003D8D3D1E